jgi:hypothetical protein
LGAEEQSALFITDDTRAIAFLVSSVDPAAANSPSNFEDNSLADITKTSTSTAVLIKAYES